MIFRTDYGVFDEKLGYRPHHQQFLDRFDVYINHNSNNVDKNPPTRRPKGMVGQTGSAEQEEKWTLAQWCVLVFFSSNA